MIRKFQTFFIFLVLLFLYLPIVILSFYSFTSATMIGSIRGFTLDNYLTLFTEPELIEMLIGTIVLALSVAVISTILGSLGAIGAFYSRRRIKYPIEFINEIPIVNADVVTGFSVCILLIVLFRMNKASYIPLLVGQVSLCAPFVYLSVMPRLKMMDGSLYEAAIDLGCSPMKAVWMVVLPQIFPGVVSGFMTAITLSLDDYFIATYTKPAAFDTISTYVVNATRGAQTQIKTALWALSAVIFLLVILITLAAGMVQSKEESR